MSIDVDKDLVLSLISMEEIVIVAGKRTPFGAFGGSLKNFSPTDLGVVSAQGAIKQAVL
jgi:acetyl-CoA C-acetyltransferase/acetyl-CoA acyltransferase 2